MYKIITLIILFIASIMLYKIFLIEEKSKLKTPENQVVIKDTNPESNKTILYKIAILSDSHVDTANLEQALTMSKNHNVKLVIHAGDLSDLATSEALLESKEILDEGAIEYFVIPGDRDLFNSDEDATSKEQTIFYDIYKEKVCKNQLLREYKILCLINPYNYNLIAQNYLDSFISDLSSAAIVISAQPLYNPDSNVYMGFFDKNVKSQADLLLSHVRNSGVNYVFSGDTHFFSFYEDDYSSGITFYTLGALSEDKNIQLPNFVIITAYEDGSYEVENVILD